MEQVELDVALEELELRLERLRSLYEQYFMGLEKIEPQIARKDIDRRIYVLRREKIRNTAKRFKLQTIIQRYNTFQQYWQRICREIENGTYKRHLIKAQKQSELLTIAARKRLGRHGRRSNPPEAAAPSQPPSQAPSAVPTPASAPPPGPVAAAAAPIAPPPSPKPASPKFESLDLDMDFMSDWDPSARRAAPKPAAPAAKPAAAPAAKPAPPAAPTAKPAPPAAAPPPKVAVVATATAATAAPAAAARPASIPPAPVAAPPRPTFSRPPTAPARPSPPAARPLGAAPPPKPLPKPVTPAPASASSNVDDSRLRDLHARLQQAKQQTKEANVSFEGLAKSIRATEAKLREQHKNRKIDFDVVIKDGKAVVKPIVR